MKKIVLFLIIIGVIFGVKATFDVKVGECLEPQAKSAYLMDNDTGTVVYALNENKRLPIASMTKIMLLDLVFESVESGKLSLDEDITVSKTASGMGGSQVFLQADKSYKANELIKSVIVASANDASVALSERLYGSESACVDVMNEKAKEWGLENTLFSNCTGLPKPTQYSCAKDVAKMLSELISHEGYFTYSNIWLDELTHPDGQKTTLTNTNKLAKFYSGCDGGKTGYTADAGFCLAATAKRGSMRVVGVYIGGNNSKQRFSDVSEMFDYAFDNYQKKIVLDKDRQPKEKIKVSCGKVDHVFIEPKESVFAFLKKTETSDFKVDFEYCDKLSAPVTKGDVIGKATVYKDGVEYKTVELVASDTVEKRTYGDVIVKIGGSW